MKKFVMLMALGLLFLSSCAVDVVEVYEIAKEVQAKYDFESVSISVNNNTAEIEIGDIDNDDYTLPYLQEMVKGVDDYITGNHENLKELDQRIYLLTGANESGVGKFTFDKDGNLLDTEEL